MLSTSAAYKKAIDAPQRIIIPKIEIYFDGPSNPPTTFNNDTVTKIDILNEAFANSSNVLGSVSSNELVVNLDNSHRQFTVKNTASKYYGKLQPGILVKAYLGIQTKLGIFEYVPLGNFYTASWYCPATNPEATMVCYDQLYTICNMDLPDVPIYEDISAAAFIKALFVACGVPEQSVVVDTTLTMIIPTAIFKGPKVRNALQDICYSFGCYITQSQDGLIKVYSIDTSVPTTRIVDDQTQIYSASVPQDYSNIYSDINIKYAKPYYGDLSLIASTENVIVPANTTAPLKLFFENPVGYVQSMTVRNTTNINATISKASTYSVVINLQNISSIDSATSVDVYGYTLQNTNLTYLDFIDNIAVQNTLNLDCNLVQDGSAARNLSNKIKGVINKTEAYAYIDCRGDICLELLDLVTISDPADKLSNVQGKLIRCKYVYDGSLSATYTFAL
jgi:hypothetical protein